MNPPEIAAATFAAATFDATTVDEPSSPPADRSRRILRMTLLGAVVLVAGALLLSAGQSAQPVAAVPNIGTGLPADTTLQGLIDGIPAGTFGTSSTFTGAGFDGSAFGGVRLANGSTRYDAATASFTAIATGTFAGDNSGVSFDVVVHAVAPTGTQRTLMVGLRASRSGGLTLADVVPVLDGKRAGSPFAERFGLVTFQGAQQPVPTAGVPAEVAPFLADVFAVPALPTSVDATAAGPVMMHALVTPGDIAGMIGAGQASGARLAGVVTSSFGAYAAMRDGNVEVESVYPTNLTITTSARTPTWAADFFSFPDGASDWTLTLNYNQALKRFQTRAQGPVWNVDIPFFAAGGATFSPSVLTTEQLLDLVASPTTVLEGTLGDYTLPGTNVKASLGLELKRTGTQYVASFTVAVALDANRTISGNVYAVREDGEWSFTLQLDVPDTSLGDLAALFGAPLASDLPQGLRTTALKSGRLIIDLAADKVSVGATGRLETSPFAGSTTSVGVSLMFFVELDATPHVMVGLAPSFRKGVQGDQPVMLSDLLGTQAGGATDFKVYDPAEPTTGFGLVYSSATSAVRIGGPPCRVTVADGQDCPVSQARTDVPTNVAQFLMPLWGFDGSDEALEDSTDPSAPCQICSFQPDFAPAIAFDVPSGLKVAASVIMPAPFGSDPDQLGTCDTDPNGEACQEALGFLGSLGLDSRVTIGGTIPLTSAAAGQVNLNMKIGLLDSPAVDRPTWLNAGELTIDVTVGKACETCALTTRFAAQGKLQIALKQGYSPTQAAATFGADSAAARENTLAKNPTAPCARSGVKLVQRESVDGFEQGATYCHDMLLLTITGDITLGTEGLSIGVVGDLRSIRSADASQPVTLRNWVSNPDGWSPMGLDKLSLDQITVAVKFQTGAAGASLAIAAAVNAQIKTTTPIVFSGAISVLIKPEGVTVDGFRLNIDELSLHNIVEIYEWISGEDVPTAGLPGVSLRNVMVSIGAQATPAVCIEQGFRLSGDLYVTDEPMPNDRKVSFTCQSDPFANDYGTLSPLPKEACDDQDIKRGCKAGIRLVVNKKGLLGDAFIASFNAGPVHLFDPTGRSQRGVSIRVEVSKGGVHLDMYGGAALGGTLKPTSCTTGPYCDAWASGRFNAQVRANSSGAEIKLFGRVTSGIPFLSFDMLAAGRANLGGVQDVVKLFTDGTIPDSNFKLHVELANSKAAPDLDFASAAQQQVDAEFAKVLEGLNDAQRIVRLLRENPRAASDLLKTYRAEATGDARAELTTLINVVDEILVWSRGVGTMDWFVNGVHFGVPGIPNVIDLANNVRVPRCDGLNWGYGPAGTLLYQPWDNFYPHNLCFLHKPVKIEGACYYLNLSGVNCSFEGVVAKLVVEPILDIVLAGIEVSTDIVKVAQKVTDTVLKGELFRIDCASFDVTLALSGELSKPVVKGDLRLGLFLTVFGEPWGLALPWKLDSEDPRNFEKNVDALFEAITESARGTATSTCWTPEQIAEFFTEPADPVDLTGAPAPQPAVITAAAVRAAVSPPLADNVTREGVTSTLVVTFDRPTATARTLRVNWGVGPSQEVAVPAGATTASVDHVFVDDGATGTPVDIARVVVFDTSTRRTIVVPVSVANAEPYVAEISFQPTSTRENETFELRVVFVDPGTRDTHRISVDWGDGAATHVDVPSGAREVTVPYAYLQNDPLAALQNPAFESRVHVTVEDDDGGSSASHTRRGIITNTPPTVTEVTPISSSVIARGVETRFRIRWTDPGTLDHHVVIVDWGDGTAAEVLGVGGRGVYRKGELVETIPGTGPLRELVVAHTFAAAPTGTPGNTVSVAVTVADLPDNQFGTRRADLTVLDQATRPSVPLALSATPTGPGRVSVAYQAPATDGGSPITSYRLVCTSSNGGTARSINGLANPMVLTGFTLGATYTCRMSATNGVGTGSSSPPTAPFVVAAVPGAPTGVSAEIAGSSRLRVTFTPPSDAGSTPITSYRTVCTGPGGGTTRSSSGSASPLVVTGLTPGIAYTCVVTATNSGGAGPASPPSSPRTVITVPAAPTDVVATSPAVPGAPRLSVGFQPPALLTSAPVSSYRALCTSPTGTARSATGAGSPIVVTGLTGGASYTCVVTASNPAGTSGRSVASPVAQPIGRPDAPTDITVAPVGPGVVHVSATPPASDGGSPITSYRAVCISSGTGVARSASRSAGPITVTRLTPGEVYTCRMSASNAFGASTASAPSTDFVAPSDLENPDVP